MKAQVYSFPEIPPNLYQGIMKNQSQQKLSCFANSEANIPQPI